MATKLPLHNPFVVIEGETFIVLNWYGEAERDLPDQLWLQRSPVVDPDFWTAQ